MKDRNEKPDFIVPQGYFENATDRIINAIVDIKPQKENEGFKVPSGYFEGLNSRITQKLEIKEIKVIKLNPFKKYYYAAAIAAVAILAFMFQINKTEEADFSFDDLVFSDIETYFETTELGFSSYEIAEMIPADELEINDMLINRIKEEHIIDYLNENIDSFEELNLENDE